MTNHKLKAEAFRFAVAVGLRSVKDVVAWADGIIAREGDPAPVFFELSLAARQNRSAVDDLLSQVPGEISQTAVARDVLREVLVQLEAGRLSERTAVRLIYNLAASGCLPETEFGYDAFSLEDSLDLAERGIYGTVADATGRIWEFLRRHAAAAA
jgi:hypothetical protein